MKFHQMPFRLLPFDLLSFDQSDVRSINLGLCWDAVLRQERPWTFPDTGPVLIGKRNIDDITRGMPLT